jgi:predicted kinase
VTGNKLIVIRGNSGSGKTSIARAIRARYGRGCALIEQDYFRRIVLREHDSIASTGIAPELIGTAAGLALDRGYHVVLEGILSTARYLPMLRDLLAAHHGESHLFYLDVSYDETVRRHATRSLANGVTPEQMRGWYRPHDVLGIAGEHVIAESSTLVETVAHILEVSSLPGAEATTYCPAICPRCRAEL